MVDPPRLAADEPVPTGGARDLDPSRDPSSRLLGAVPGATAAMLGSGTLVALVAAGVSSAPLPGGMLATGLVAGLGAGAAFAVARWMGVQAGDGGAGVGGDVPRPQSAIDGDRPGAEQHDVSAASGLGQVPRRRGVRGFGAEGSIEGGADRARAALAGLTDAVLVIDGLGEVVFANPAADKRLRAPGDTRLRGQDLDRVFGRSQGAGAVFAPVAETVRSVLAGQQGDPVTIRDLAYEGHVLDVEIARSGDGADVAAVCIVHDVTTRLEIERLKDVFLSSVSHELRTPLTNICAFVELLRGMEPGAREWPEFLGVVEAESQRLSRHVQALLDFSRLRAGEVQWSIETLSVQRVVGEVATLFRGRARAEELQLHVRGVELEAEDGGSLWVRADSAWLIRCLSELLDNAAKFTPAGGAITIRCVPGDKTHEVFVEDTGPGVSALDRERVFDELNQLGDGVTGKPDGIGLGLTLARAAAEGMGGRLECVEPPTGSGACLRCALPAAVPVRV